MGDGDGLLWCGGVRHCDCNCHNCDQKTAVLPAPRIHPTYQSQVHVLFINVWGDDPQIVIIHADDNIMGASLEVIKAT